MRIARLLLLLAGAATLSVVVVVFAIWMWWLRDPSDDQRSRGVNAMWAAHKWVGDAHSDAQYRALAEQLLRHEISDVFFHAGPLEADGSVPDDLIEHAAPLLAAMNRYAPEIRAQAYLGQIEKRGDGPLDLDDPLVRARIVETAEDFLDLGFDGIHYDIEPIFPGDESFLDLLERTRAVTEPRGAVLSVAVEQVEFAPRAQKLIAFFFRRYHDPPTGFLQDVAVHVDQVAIMTYDSSMPIESLFGAHMAWQTQRVVKAIGDDVTVFMGVPTYEDGKFPRFHSRAENIRSGIRGVRKGLDGLDDARTNDVGIAIFAEWTTTDDDWDVYVEEWLEETP